MHTIVTRITGGYQIIEIDIMGLLTLVFTIIIAGSAVATAIAAWRALSSWKKDPTYKLAMRCMYNTTNLYLAMMTDRQQLSCTKLAQWSEVPWNSLVVMEEKFGFSSFEAQYHFGEKKVGSIFNDFYKISIEFRKCAQIYWKYKNGATLDNAETPLLGLAKEIFDPFDPLNPDEKYQEKVKAVVLKIEIFLKPHMKID